MDMRVARSVGASWRVGVAAVALAAGLCAGSGAGVASAQTYSVTDLGILPQSSATIPGQTFPRAVSNVTSVGTEGAFVVGGATQDRALRAFVWTERAGIREGTGGLALSGSAWDVNDWGVFVGGGIPRTNVTPTTRQQAFEVADGQLRWLAPLTNAGVATAFGVNNARTIVGSASDAGGASRAAVWFPGAARPMDLGTLGGRESVAYAVNGGNWVVGGAQNRAGVTRAFIANASLAAPMPMRELGGLSRDGFSVARDVNADRAAVGQSALPITTSNAPALRATLFSFSNTGGAVNLGVLRNTDTASDALGLNDGGAIVGWSGSVRPTATVSFGQRAFIWRDGRMVDLNTLIPATSGWVLLGASEINDSGQIVGWGYNRRAGGTFNVAPVRGFLLTPRQ